VSRAAWIRAAMLAALLATLQGCALAPTGMYSEYEHVSHPLAGAPFGPENEEDWLDQLNVGAKWERGGAYLHAGIGYVLTDGGFFGPRLTGSIRAGYHFNFGN
jgi:hypothetical protein